MENEIMQKSGINILKEAEKEETKQGAKNNIKRQETPKPDKPAAEYTSSGGHFVSGIEEDLNVAQDEILGNEGAAELDEAELERLAQETFDSTLERRDESLM